MNYAEVKEAVIQMNICDQHEKGFKYACIIWYGLNNGWEWKALRRNIPYSDHYLSKCIRVLTYNEILKDGVMYMESGFDEPLHFIIELSLIVLLCEGKIKRHKHKEQLLLPPSTTGLPEFVVPPILEPYQFYVPHDVR